MIGNDDEKLLKPVLNKLIGESYDIKGPYASDSFFGSQSYKNFDAIVATYHDQGLIPFKTLTFGKGVNFTAGLDIVRTSPDHGTAYDISGKNIANYDSFKSAIFTSIEIVKNRGKKLVYSHSNFFKKMSKVKGFSVKFIGLKEGTHNFQFPLSKSFFETFEYSEFNSVDINVDLVLVKKSTIIELSLKGTGSVNINCTLTNEPFDYQINSKLNLLVKFGDSYDDENDELLVLPHGSHSIDLDQYFYEMIVLSMPIRNVHPDVENGTIDSEILNRLKEFDINKEKNSNFDARWDKLKELKK